MPNPNPNRPTPDDVPAAATGDALEVTDLAITLDDLPIEDLLDLQQALTRDRLRIKRLAEQVQEQVDRRSRTLLARQAEERRRFGEERRPPRQLL